MNQLESACSTKNCKNMTAACCEVCGFHYCSIDCQTIDSAHHKITCSPIKYDRLRKFVEFKTSLSEDSIYLSIAYTHIPLYGLSGYVKAIDIASTTHACVICSKKIEYEGPKWDLMFTINHECRDKESDKNKDSKNEDMVIKVYCHRCIDCNSKNLMLFPVNYMTLAELHLYFLMCINKYNICLDIRRYLCSFIKYEYPRECDDVCCISTIIKFIESRKCKRCNTKFYTGKWLCEEHASNYCEECLEFDFESLNW